MENSNSKEVMNVTAEFMTVKQIAEVLNVSTRLVQEVILSLALKCVRKGRSHAYCLTKEQSIQVMNYINTNRRVSGTCNEVALQTNKEQLYVASNETLTQVVAMLAKGQEETRQIIQSMQQYQHDNMVILKEILATSQTKATEEEIEDLTKIWWTSASIYQMYKDKFSDFGVKDSRGVSRYINSKIKENPDLESFRRTKEGKDYPYYEFRADFVKNLF